VNILGIDPGTTKTGITHITGTVKKPKFESELIGYECAPENVPVVNVRLLHIGSMIIEMLDRIAPDFVVIEYPFNIKGNARVIAELIGVIRFHCLRMCYPYLFLPQTRVKKYATGKGNCEKSDIRMQAYKELGLDLSEDKADSLFIAHFGMGYMYPETISHKHRLESIEAVKNGKLKKVKKQKEKVEE
jgi:Holliday junction resolvasome RuvABC endonuclease subunit